MFEYLQDKDFLIELDNLHNKVKYLKMTMLTFNEEPIMDIEGRALSGTVSVNGNSAIRRTCNFQMGLKIEESSNPIVIEDYVSVDKKFQLYIGYENPLAKYKHYGDIIWFNLGMYVISDYNLSYSNSGIRVNISAKDKMCLLDGSVGGTIPASTIFHEKYIYNDDEEQTITIQYPTIVQIIREAVNHFGGEDLNKILINDLEEKVKVLMEYRGDQPIWFNSDFSHFEIGNDQPGENYINKFTYGQTIGYRWEDFTYPGELILSAGETVVTLLDKVKAVLGNFEYFYDLNGNFIFQEIRNYLNTSYTPILNLDNETYFRYFSDKPYDYSFNRSQLLTSLSKNPSIGNIKNDFIVWGTRESNIGSSIGIRYHLAIDKKPKIVRDVADTVDFDLDWREMIYRQICEDAKMGTSTSDYNYYSAEMLAEWRYLYCPYTEKNEALYVTEEEAKRATEWKTLWTRYYGESIPWTGWNPAVYESPQELNYFLDFIDSSAEIGKYSVQKIGRRTQVINDSDVTSIYTTEIPDIIFVESEKIDPSNPNYDSEYLKLQNQGQKLCALTEDKWDLFNYSSQGKSCYDVIRELLYQNLTLNTTISLQCFPIYYLEPNVLIEVNEPAADTYGNFLIQSFNLPLNYSGTMNISATQAQIRV